MRPRESANRPPPLEAFITGLFLWELVCFNSANGVVKVLCRRYTAFQWQKSTLRYRLPRNHRYCFKNKTKLFLNPLAFSLIKTIQEDFFFFFPPDWQRKSGLWILSLPPPPFFILNPDFSTLSVHKPDVSRPWPLYTLRSPGAPTRQNACRNFWINKPAVEDWSCGGYQRTTAIHSECSHRRRPRSRRHPTAGGSFPSRVGSVGTSWTTRDKGCGGPGAGPLASCKRRKAGQGLA